MNQADPKPCYKLALSLTAYRIDYSTFTSTTYDGDTYHDMPSYEWKQGFNPDAFAKEIDSHNNQLFTSMLDDLLEGVGISRRGASKPNCKTQVTALHLSKESKQG